MHAHTSKDVLRTDVMVSPLLSIILLLCHNTFCCSQFNSTITTVKTFMICNINNDNPEFTQENESFFTCHLLPHFTCMQSHTCTQMQHYTFSDTFEGNSDTSIPKWWTLAQSSSKNSYQSSLAGTISHTRDHQPLFPCLLSKTVHVLLAIQNHPQ